MGLVFYGRRQTVSILDCYLKRNLAKNGGLLDGVIWLERTMDSADLALLDKIIETEPDYVRQKVDLSQGGYASSYDDIEDDVMYVKIDDDIVYIEDTAIPSIVQTKAARPDLYVVSANVVNQPLISWIHRNLEVIRPYLPEIDKPYPEPEHGDRVDWRSSLLPDWKGPADFEVETWSSAHNEKHRWLPVTGKLDHTIVKTPIEQTEYDPFGRGLSQWQVGAQEHYSLLENLENNELWRYKFHTWDFQYQRMGIQFIAMMGRDINLAKPIHWDDEGYFAVDMPKKLGRHAVADGRGVVAHYSYSNQVADGGGMATTDVLDRYRSFALERICNSAMLWTSEENNTDE
ncbi:Uncharacterized protein TPAR_02439 [Tolypocladium paradoxum]|uniref:Uncharacterized protein n=1 Tax=Tolypocladium paradoxum TaxID=94208 RepID=A0A2S4L4L5_9HYPO|nr:Uncharacterized protein TPAR_02439 [Tolypocladium paradoxum]